MRRVVVVFAAALAGVLATAASAAPTCERLDGLTARCGTSGAMPVGWQPTPQQLLEMRAPRPPQEVALDVIGSVCLLGALATLIASMPQFDGWEADDWDEQEGDPPRRSPRSR